jgi:hypothetical protein
VGISAGSALATGGRGCALGRPSSLDNMRQKVPTTPMVTSAAASTTVR